jgi:hypothetical protein
LNEIRNSLFFGEFLVVVAANEKTRFFGKDFSVPSGDLKP